MKNSKPPLFYLFALTPRVKSVGHKFIVPTKLPIPKHMLDARWCTSEPDYPSPKTSVQRKVFRTLADGIQTPGIEYITFITSGHLLSPEAKQTINQLLEPYQDMLADLVTKQIDWSKKDAGLIERHPALDQWTEELRPKVIKILRRCNRLPQTPPKPSLRGVMFLILSLAILYAGLWFWKNGLPNGNNWKNSVAQFGGDILKNLPNLNSFQSTEPANDIRDQWIQELNIKDVTVNASPQEKENAIKEKLSQCFINSKFDNLEHCLRTLNFCLGKPVPDNEPTLEQLLGNDRLRQQIMQVFENPVDLCKKEHDEIEPVFRKYIPKETSIDDMKNRLESLRQLASSAIDISLQAPKAKELSDKSWVHFANTLDFLSAGQNKSKEYKEIITEYKPQFMTTADIEVMRFIYQWLTNVDAEVHIGDGTGNLQSALSAVVNTNDDSSPFAKHSERALGSYIYDKNNRESKELEALYKSFQAFRKHAEAMMKILRD